MTQDFDKLVARVEAIPPEHRTEAASAVLALAKRLEEAEGIARSHALSLTDELARRRKAEDELEAVKADNRRILEEHARIIEINKNHCATVNSYILDNSRQDDARKAAEARAAQLEAENGRLREALKDIGNWSQELQDRMIADGDCLGQWRGCIAIARAALTGREG